MTGRRDDAEIARLEKRLRQARDELAEVRQQGQANAPVLERLREHLDQNRFAERLYVAMEQSRRHA